MISDIIHIVLKDLSDTPLLWTGWQQSPVYDYNDEFIPSSTLIVSTGSDFNYY